MSYSSLVTTGIPVSVGLGGDGDEIEALEDVERAFGVKLDDSDAPQWLTAGDLFDSLRRVLPADQRDTADLWDRFAEALCGVTGVDPKTTQRSSPLLTTSHFWARMTYISAAALIIVVLTFIAALATSAPTRP